MNILLATAEAYPFCRTGGLGDVCGSLPRELAKLGHRPVVVIPAFREAMQTDAKIESTGITFEIPIGQKRVEGQLLRSHLPGSEVPVILIQQDDYYDRKGIYAEDGEEYRDNCERFTFFCRAAIEAIVLLELETEVVHCNDWCAGLIPAYLKTVYSEQPAYEQLATLFTIHNLAYQGNFWHWDMALTGIDWKYFNWRQMEFFGNLSFMKTGIVFADTISTVSPTYAQEILRSPLGCGMEEVLRHRVDDLFGILNGADYDAWNPATDPFLGENGYDATNFSVGKAACKAALQSDLGLPVRPEVPLLATVGRLADQKGLDLIARVMQQWATEVDAQWVLLGTGDAKYHQVFGKLAAEHPEKIAVRLEFSNALAHQIEAGADMFLMPSQYEPCGLNQLYSLKYGTVPVVRATGGLADTVVDTTPETLAAKTATGFAFREYSSLALADALERACQTFVDKSIWNTLVERGMRQNWSWEASAGHYAALYDATRQRTRKEVLSN